MTPGLAVAGTRELRPLLEQIFSEMRTARARQSRLVVRSAGKVVFLQTGDLEWVEASGNYVRLHAGQQPLVLRASMKTMEAKLDPTVFVRIHRSAIVNVDYIRELEPWMHGEFVVRLRGGQQLMASRVFSDRLARLID